MKSTESIDVSRRFFEVVDHLLEQKKLTGVRGFCREFSINPGTYYHLRNKPETYQIPVAPLVKLIKDFKVSAHWLMTGEGEMFL